MITEFTYWEGKQTGFKFWHRSNSGNHESTYFYKTGVKGYTLKGYWQWDSIIYKGEDLPEVTVEADREENSKPLPSLLSTN
jgi:hypothetical protein